MRFIYSDETDFTNPKPCIGTGMLVTDIEINREFIDKALENLKNDPDRFNEPEKKLDDATLARKYFHASEDSKNAHSHLCTEINKIRHAEFSCDFFEKGTGIYHEQASKALYRQTAVLSSLHGLNTREKVIFTFEDRSGISKESLKVWHSKIEKDLLMGIYDLPFAPCYFPQAEFKIEGKANPGLQCVDFILWACNRKDKWLDRIQSIIKTKFSTDNNYWKGHDISFGTGINEPKCHYHIKDFPENPDSIINQEIFKSFYIHAAKVVEHYFNNPTPNIKHFIRNSQTLIRNKKNPSFKNYFDRLCSIYLKLFDMVPIITNCTSTRDKTYLLLSKKYLSLLLREDLLHGVRCKIWLEDIRKTIIQEKPHLLDFY